MTARGDVAPVPPKRESLMHVSWAGEHRFDTGRPNGPVARLDGSGQTGQSPPDALLSALATCSAVDVVDILGKRRTPPARLSVEVRGVRREEMPRRFTELHLAYHIDGAGIDAIHVERAISLAFEKYCSVAASLAPDIVVKTTAIVNGVAATAKPQTIRG
ncbi:MAG TPA: OsmC family protein [Gemmatimonadaceae bacterium]|jgi:putative redox protein